MRVTAYTRDATTHFNDPKMVVQGPKELRDGVQVWSESFKGSVRYARLFWSILSDEERGYVSRLCRCDQERFVFSRGILKVILGYYLQRPAHSVGIRTGGHGKLELMEQLLGVQFSLSHSHDLVLCAVVHGRRVGIDVEPISAVDPDEMAVLKDQFLCSREREYIWNLRKNQRNRALSVFWVRKEAYLKGSGRAGKLRPASVDVSEAGTVRLVLARSGEEGGMGWMTSDFSPAPGYVAALVTENEVKE